MPLAPAVDGELSSGTCMDIWKFSPMTPEPLDAASVTFEIAQAETAVATSSPMSLRDAARRETMPAAASRGAVERSPASAGDYVARAVIAIGPACWPGDAPVSRSPHKSTRRRQSKALAHRRGVTARLTPHLGVNCSTRAS